MLNIYYQNNFLFILSELTLKYNYIKKLFLIIFLNKYVDYSNYWLNYVISIQKMINIYYILNNNNNLKI